VNVRIQADLAEVSREAADFVAGAIRRRPNLSLALPTGRTPLGMYGELVRMHREEHLDFSNVRFFSLDEYVGLPESDPRSFRSYLWSHLFQLTNSRRENITLAPSAGDGDVDAYEQAILRAGGLDLLIAGLGANGHIAFNEPGSRFDSRTRVVSLADSTLDGMRNNFEEGELPRQAVTVGIGTILEARGVLLLVSGNAKKDALSRVLHGPIQESVPGSVLRLHSNVTVVTDRVAAGG
jgi:glucosamine-6-phosphate deaminase